MPVSGLDHLWIEEEIPAGEGEDPTEHRSANPAPDQQGRIGHHRPGQRDDQRDASQSRPKGRGVFIAAEWPTSGCTDGLAAEADAGGDEEQAPCEPPSARDHGVRQRRRAPEQHRDHR